MSRHCIKKYLFNPIVDIVVELPDRQNNCSKIAKELLTRINIYM